MISLYLLLTFISISSCVPIKNNNKICKIDTHTEPIKQKNVYKIKNNFDNLLIDIHFFVFHDNINGKVSKDTLKKQILVLNKAFSGKYSKKSMIDSNIRFRLSSVNYINNKNFYKKCDNYEYKMTKIYSKENDKSINIMICESFFYLGWAYLPWHFHEKNKMNSIFVNTVSLPDKQYNGYNLGMTAVHEVGHFFGLLHTFSYNNECIDGDMIADTPIEKSPSFTCIEKDTCPNHPGKDPVTNFMDYSPDECMYEFTFLQINRMSNMIDKYKPKLKKKSMNNYLRTLYSVKYYRKGSGLCVDSNGKKLVTIRISGNVMLSHSQCKQNLNEYNSFAYTYIIPEKAKLKNLKYNCFIHQPKLEEKIKTDKLIDKKKYFNANCFVIKLIPKL